MKTVLGHDYLLVMRGAERTFAEMAKIWPDAPVHTLLADREMTGEHFRGHPIHASWLTRSRWVRANFRSLLPLYPAVISRMEVSDADVLLTSSSAYAHGLRAPAGAVHICYCHSPFRYVWHERERAMGEFPKVGRPVAAPVLGQIRRWDRRAASRVDHWIANSKVTQDRMADFWGVEAPIVHPPVDTDRFHVGAPEDFFLVVGELAGHKKVELAIRAAARVGVRIRIVGEGPDKARLERQYAGQAEFLGRIPDRDLVDVMSRALAVITPNVEEFGIAAVESQAAGRPVIGPDEGGTAETVIDGETGVLFTPGDEDALSEILSEYHFDRFSPDRIREHARTFDKALFAERMEAAVENFAGGPGVRGHARADLAAHVTPSRSASV